MKCLFSLAAAIAVIFAVACIVADEPVSHGYGRPAVHPTTDLSSSGNVIDTSGWNDDELAVTIPCYGTGQSIIGKTMKAGKKLRFVFVNDREVRIEKAEFKLLTPNS
jgi:hypothetical protein